MKTSKRPEWPGLLSSAMPTGQAPCVATRKGTKRNPWVVIAFFGLVIASWINGLI